MDEEKLLALAAVGQDEVERLSQQLGKPVSVDMSALVMLARIAMHQPDDGDYMRSHVRVLVEDMIRRFPNRQAFRYEYEPPDADGRRGPSVPVCRFYELLAQLTVGVENPVRGLTRTAGCAIMASCLQHPGRQPI